MKAQRWYVEYYFKIPDKLKYLHGNQEWKRFRIFEDINRRRGPEKKQYAKLLLKAVEHALVKENYNPFTYEERYFVKKEIASLNMVEAIDFFIENIGEKGLEKSTIIKYTRTANYLKNYLLQIGKGRIEPRKVDNLMIENCLLFYKRSIPWSNTNYNKSLGFLSIMFNYLIKKKKLAANPCDGLKKLKAVSKKHRYYDTISLKMVTDYMEKNDPYLLVAAQFIYYAGVRSSKELISLQVGDVLIDRDRIRFRGDATKGKREDYIFLDPKLKDIFIKNGFQNYPLTNYIFTFAGQPGEIKSAEDFLQKRFRKVRAALDLSQDYTLYSFKHTRAVNLLQDGAQPVDIMQLFRHTDLTTTTKYIRDLGFDLNTGFSKLSRDI